MRVPLGAGFAGRIAVERMAIFIADVDHADIMNPILREKGIRSLMGVPLIVEGDLIGVLHIGSLQPRTFDIRDLAVLELAAARAAPAIERGRLLHQLEREHRHTVTLQRSLLPRRLPSAPGLSVAARYVPARDEVGGDWYDTITLGDGQVGVAIGDVVGHGIGAAALMGQLRTALRAYALTRDSPSKVLTLVDRFVDALDEDVMATAAYALVDLDSGWVRYASAGHLPPVLIAGGEPPRALDLAPAPPLGAFGHRLCPEYDFTLNPGDILLLYTDGLIERPGISLIASIGALAEALAGVRSTEEACLTAMDRMLPELGPRDDVAVLAVSVEPAPQILVVELPARPASLVSARRQLRRWLRAQDIDEVTESEFMIAAGEACSNAVEHAYSPGRGTFSVRGTRTDDVIELSIQDHGQWRPPRGEHRGRGLSIMRAAMDSVEITAGAEGSAIVLRRSVQPS